MSNTTPRVGWVNADRRAGNLESREVRELSHAELALVSGGKGTVKAGYDIKTLKTV